MNQAPVDILIIGAGAAGAAFAWSMTDTRMRVLCLEQGEWMNPAEYPSTGLDGELRQAGEFSSNPSARLRTQLRDANRGPLCRSSAGDAAARP